MTASTSAHALVRQLGPRLRSRAESLATAESCTGGLLGAMLTEVPGSSDYYVGGIVAYTNRVKCALLGVDRALIERRGAVCEPVAAAMAAGARSRLGADYALSITGIAGPGGGTPAKPVGLVFVGLATPTGVRVARYVFPGDRDAVRRASCSAALHALLDTLTAIRTPRQS